MLWRPGKARARERSTDRLPPGQKWVGGWPVLHEGDIPAFDPATWRLRVWGEVEQEVEWTWEQLSTLPRAEVVKDWHCVTTWSKMDNRWGGVSVQAAIAAACPKPSAKYVLVHSYDEVGYTTNLTYEDFARPENLLCTHHDGAPLDREHGGPIRLIVHHLYAWKSAKWISGIQLLREDQRGFWEQRGYHNRADPWLDERYSYQE